MLLLCLTLQLHAVMLAVVLRAWIQGQLWHCAAGKVFCSPELLLFVASHLADVLHLLYAGGTMPASLGLMWHV